MAGPARGVNVAPLVARPFAPYKPPPAPAGSYDPVLDAQLGQAQRGLGDLRTDTETANTRDTVDYGLGRDAINLSQTRGNQDLDRQVTMLQRSYDQLGRRQNEGARHQGILSGGLLMAAAAKRAANQQFDMQPLTTSRTRLTEDSDLARGRLALDLAPPSADNPLGGRRFQDRTTALTRGEREGVQFGLDVDAQKMFQASGAGYVPPGRGEKGGIPSNERIDALGQHTRTTRVGDWIITYDSTGRVVSRRRAASSKARTTGPNTAAGTGRI